MLKQCLQIAVIATALVLSGCASKGKKSVSSVPAASTQSSSGFSGSGMDDSIGGVGTGTGLEDQSGLDLSERTVYFEYDSAELSPKGQEIVAHFGRYLATNPNARLRLEGHTDERGTREYNISLGERRANTVQSALIAYGASASQLSVVSYGEERPVDPGHDEAAYAQNRRVEIIQL
jgi:peptidoglycan-associated lipoprotein